MPRFPILDRSRKWKGDVMPTNAIAESGALRGQVSRLGLKGFPAIRLRERLPRPRSATLALQSRSLQGLLHPAVAQLDSRAGHSALTRLCRRHSMKPKKNVDLGLAPPHTRSLRPNQSVRTLESPLQSLFCRDDF